jgi:hypothetical protein
MKKFFFNTGVKQGIPLNERHRPDAKPVPLMEGQVWINGIKKIPFECEDVPDNYILSFLSDSPNISGDYLIREVHNSTLLSKYAYFISRGD